MSQVILGTGRKTSQQEEWLCQSIALVSTRPLQLQALQLREMFDRIKPKLLSQDSDWQKKKYNNFPILKKLHCGIRFLIKTAFWDTQT